MLLCGVLVVREGLRLRVRLLLPGREGLRLPEREGLRLPGRRLLLGAALAVEQRLSSRSFSATMARTST